MFTRKQFKIAVIVLAALYALILLGRIVYDFSVSDGTAIEEDYYFSGYKEDFLRNSVNVASSRKEYSGASGVEILDQKYERISSLSAKSASYEEDLSQLNTAIEQFQAVVQWENAQGLTGSRRVSRVIGVKPQYYDDCLAAVQRVGALISFTSQKNDKTYEYNQMLAQKQELEKRRDSYTALRDRGGGIQEMLSLEDKIIEVESQLLQQSVDLGEYSDDNALCTINFSLYEGSPIPMARKLWNAFMWTNGVYFALLGGALFVCLAAYILVKAYRSLRGALTAGEKEHGAPVSQSDPDTNIE